MALKRSAQPLDTALPRRKGPKRVKLSPSAAERSDSSVASLGSVSEDSVLQSSPPASAHTQQSSFSSAPSSNSGEDSDSSLSTEEDSDEEDEIVTIGGPKKPDITDDSIMQGSVDLRARLMAFLPQLADANEELSSGPGQHSMEDVEDDEQHIEMNLGLGVLEQKGYEPDSESSDDESAPIPTDKAKRHAIKKEKSADVMGKLLGRSKARRKSGIEDLE